jgi:hypothetical protein
VKTPNSFARRVFFVAGIYGIAVLLTQYVLAVWVYAINVVEGDEINAMVQDYYSRFQASSCASPG